MTHWMSTRTTALGLSILLFAGCAQSEFTGSQSQDIATSEAPPTPRPSPKAKVKAPADQALIAKPIVLPETPPPAKVELPPISMRGTLLQRLPKSTLFAVRLPHVEKLSEAIARSPLPELFANPAMSGAREEMESGLAGLERELGDEFPDLAELKSRFFALEGELVVALISVDARVMAGHADEVTGCPMTFALLFDAGEHADDFQHLLDRALDSIAKDIAKDPSTALKFDVVSAGNGAWHRHASFEGVGLELAREGSQFVLQVGPQPLVPAVTAPLPRRPLEDSFAAAHVVRATRDLSREGSVPVAECFLNLDPVWTVVEMFGDADVKRIIDTLGARSIHGMSSVAALGQTGIDEVLLIDSPDGNDFFTRVFAAHPIDPAVARFMPDDASAAAVGSIDMSELLDTVYKLLPAAGKAALDDAFDSAATKSFDLRKDLLAKVGPTIGITGDVEQLARFGQGLSTNGLELTFVVQLADAPAMRKQLDQFIQTTPLRDHVRSREMYGFTTHRLEPMPMQNRTGGATTMVELSWCIDDHALILSYTNAGLAHALAAASAVDSAPGAMQRALKEQPGAFSLTKTSKDDTSITVGRRTSLGLEVATHEGKGTTSGYALLCTAGIAGATAMPALMSGRTEANEAAAMKTLREIEQAEREFRSARNDDLDRDGDGEFGTLGELTGATGLRSLKPALKTPLLPATMRPDGDGCFTMSGYVFRIDVARRTPRNVDDDEREFMAYAWPVSGLTGSRVFMIDADGRIMTSDNQGEKQRYAGATRMPELDAGKRALSSRPLIGVRGRIGRDGGNWSRVE
jgi:hypothetical protein